MAVRTIFAIHDGKAHLSIDGTDRLTHIDWMISQGVLKSPTDPAYESVVRGQLVGDHLTLYRGSMFTLPDKTPELYSRLRQISQKLGLDKRLPVRVATYGGPMGAHGSTSHRLNYVLWKIWSDEEAEPRPAS